MEAKEIFTTAGVMWALMAVGRGYYFRLELLFHAYCKQARLEVGQAMGSLSKVASMSPY